MNSFNKFYQNYFFAGMDKVRGRKNIERLKFLRHSQYWSSNQLKEWQLSRLNKLIKNAIDYSAFYKEKLTAFKSPLKSISELQRLPILSKNAIREHRESILCNNANRNHLELSKTGGSTGEPTYYYLDRNSKDWNRGSVYRSSEWAGISLGDRTVQMSGSHFDFTQFNKLKWKIVFWLQRYKDLPVSSVDEETYENYYKIIQRFRPRSIWGYASGIFLFSQFVKKYHPKSCFNFLKAIITSSETLRPAWRDEINQVFDGEKVFDHYGSREVYIASECKEHQGYHIHSDVIILEVVDEDGKQLPAGEVGRILITDLSNLSFPFIRYEIGDVGSLSEEIICPCGVRLPKLQSIEGRIADILHFKDRIVTPPNLTILLSDYPGIEQYQFLQNSLDALNVKIIKNSKFTSSTQKYIKDSLQKLVGNEVEISLDYVDKIEVPKSGKRRYIISTVK